SRVRCVGKRLIWSVVVASKVSGRFTSGWRIKVSACCNGRPPLPSAGKYVHFVGSPAFKFAYTPAKYVSLSCFRAEAKNHKRSRRIGPPTDPLKSYASFKEFGCVRPRVLRSSE